MEKLLNTSFQVEEYDETFISWVNSSDIKKYNGAFLRDIAIRNFPLLFS